MALNISTTQLGEDLVSLADTKTFLRISDTSDDAILTLLIQDASRAIEDYLGYDLFRQTYVEDLSGQGGNYLLVSRVPLESITSIVKDDSTTSLDSTTYEIHDMRVGSIYSTVGWSFSPFYSGDIAPGDPDPKKDSQNYQVTYVAGYQPADDTTVTSTVSTNLSTVPGAMKMAAYNTVRDWYFTVDRDRTISRIESEDFVIQYRGEEDQKIAVGELPLSAQRLLRPFELEI